MHTSSSTNELLSTAEYECHGNVVSIEGIGSKVINPIAPPRSAVVINATCDAVTVTGSVIIYTGKHATWSSSKFLSTFCLSFLFFYWIRWMDFKGCVILTLLRHTLGGTSFCCLQTLNVFKASHVATGTTFRTSTCTNHRNHKQYGKIFNFC